MCYEEHSDSEFYYLEDDTNFDQFLSNEPSYRKYFKCLSITCAQTARQQYILCHIIKNLLTSLVRAVCE